MRVLHWRARSVFVDEAEFLAQSVIKKDVVREVCAHHVPPLQVPCLLAWSLSALPAPTATFTDFKAADDCARSECVRSRADRLVALCGECIGVAPLEVTVLARVFFCSTPRCAWTLVQSQLIRPTSAGKRTCPRCLTNNVHEDVAQRVTGLMQKLLLTEFDDDLPRWRRTMTCVVSNPHLINVEPASLLGRRLTVIGVLELSTDGGCIALSAAGIEGARRPALHASTLPPAPSLGVRALCAAPAHGGAVLSSSELAVCEWRRTTQFVNSLGAHCVGQRYFMTKLSVCVTRHAKRTDKEATGLCF